jgi:3-oxoacyl-[acyl-carrier protein] reductase
MPIQTVERVKAMGRVDERIAIITGGGHGIGKAISLLLAREGASVFILDVDLENAAAVSDEIMKTGRKSKAFKVDVSNSLQVNEAVNEIARDCGGIDILINNAGIITSHENLLTISDEAWDKEIAIDLTGAFYCTRAVLKYMMEKHYGKIINMASIAADTGRMQASAAYSAAKGGLIGLTMSVARSAAKYGINVNAVCPGIIMTGILDCYPKEVLDGLIKEIPYPRMGTVEDVANAVLFLASGESDYITGSRVRVNGGTWMG